MKNMTTRYQERYYEDVAAYIGATNAANTSEEETVRWVCCKGAKPSRTPAHRWFPQLPIGRYRE